VPDLYLVVDPTRYGRRCEVCQRRPARAYFHPNPLRSTLRVYRCKRHNRVRFVPLDEKQGLGGGVYR
jgi:hypothetical protein